MVEGLELEVARLKVRLTALEGEVRIFTPPVSRIERDLWEFRTEMNQRMDALERRMGSLENRIGSLENRIGSLENRIGSLENRIGSLEKRVDVMHTDLTQKLDQVLVQLRELIQVVTK